MYSSAASDLYKRQLPVGALGDNALPHQTLAIDTISEREETHEIVDVFSYFKATLLTVVKECNNRNRRDSDCDRIALGTIDKENIHVDSFLGTVDQATVDSLYTTGVDAARRFDTETSERDKKTTDPEHK